MTEPVIPVIALLSLLLLPLLWLTFVLIQSIQVCMRLHMHPFPLNAAVEQPVLHVPLAGFGKDSNSAKATKIALTDAPLPDERQ